MYRYAAGLILTALLMSGAACTKVKFHPLDPASSYEPTSEIKMFRNYPEAAYTIIGTFRAVGPNKEKLLKNIRKQAMKIGAQGLVVKPMAERSNKYTSQRQSHEFSKKEYIMEAEALRFKAADN